MSEPFALFGAVHTDDPFVQDSEIQHFYAQGATFGAARTQLKQLELTEVERALLAQQHQQTALLMPLQDRVIKLVESGQHAEAEEMMIDHVVPAQTEMVKTLTSLLENAIAKHTSTPRTDAQHRIAPPQC